MQNSSGERRIVVLNTLIIVADSCCFEFTLITDSSVFSLFVHYKCAVSALYICILLGHCAEYLLCMSNLTRHTSCSNACWDWHVGVGVFSSFSTHSSNTPTTPSVPPPTGKPKKTKRYYFRRKPKSPIHVYTPETEVTER